MFSLTAIAKMNSLAAIAKEQARAKALNHPKHPKKSEELWLAKVFRDAKKARKAWPAWAIPASKHPKKRSK